MTKRTLYIIICLLLFLDVSAIFIYIVGNSNRDGKNALDFSRDSSIPAEVADTIPDRLIEDRYDTIIRNASLVATDVVASDGKRMTCDIKFKLVWPKSINNKTELKVIEDAIMEKLFGKDFLNINDAMNTTMANPQFVKPAKQFVIVESNSREENSPNHTKLLYRAFPYFRTSYLLEYVILIEKYQGDHAHRTMKVVHYDRLHNKIISIDRIFDLSHQAEILALVNQKIEALKLTKKNAIHETLSMPTDFILGTKSVIFYLPDGAIAPAGTGLYEVSVHNSDLTPFFTSEYNELLNNDSHFDSYGFLDW